MAIKRTICCDVCGKTEEERHDGQGWPSWGALQGIALNGVANPNLCPEHLAKVASFVDAMKEKHHGMD